MTVPIARVVATRYATAEPPLRFCYFAHAYRGVRPHRGQMREFLQAGIELIGAPAPDGHRRGADRPVPRARRDRACATTGSGSATRRCTRTLLRRAAASPRTRRRPARATLVARDFVGLERELARLGLDDADAELLLRVPQLRGGPEVLDDAQGPVADAVARPAPRLRAARARGRRARHLRPRPRRATSATTRARSSRSTTRRSARRSAAAGATTTCSGASAAPLPAVGFALGVDRLHIALTGEERGA